MRIAVLSDIHSNLAALEAVLSDLPAVDEAWVLGDTVGYGPQPNEVIVALQALGARSVLGNHDGAAVGTVDTRPFNPDARRAIEWTVEVIDANSRAYLASLPEVRTDGDLTAVHGSPRNPIWEYIFSDEVAADCLAEFETQLCLFGHTHVPIVFVAAGTDDVEPLASLPDLPVELRGRRALINPGSVGQPRDGNPAASYAILDTDAGRVDFRRVRYDIDRTQRLMRDAGLPPRLAERLSYGR
jgi:diadenosine tetraphosphatase ApaH/serine/threonine PP2A family protein phosphatase